jgi:methionyl-tRNA formyltransferase
MKITVFTSNQPRHLSLIENLARVADTVYAVQESSTVFPGEAKGLYRASEVMKKYFEHVVEAERSVFGDVRFLPPNVNNLVIQSGDLSRMDMSVFGDALKADLFIVFGVGYIQGDLVDALIERRAVNIHMGASPYYRGSSCNFWALYDGNADLVGATVHRLSRGLDSGGMLFHALPEQTETDPFELGMQAVRAAHDVLLGEIKSGGILDIEPVAQNRDIEIRYSRKSDFTDEIAAEYMARRLKPVDVAKMMEAAPKRELLLPK